MANGDVVSDRAVVAVLIVVSTPILQLFTGIGKAHEPMGIQALGAELAVERFGEPVVGRLSKTGEVQRDPRQPASGNPGSHNVEIHRETQEPGSPQFAAASSHESSYSRPICEGSSTHTTWRIWGI